MNAPRLRFKEFSGDWEVKKLGNFIVERNEYPEDKLPIFSLTIENGVTPKTERYERAFLVNDEKNAYKIVLKDDFAYNPMNLRFGAIAKYSGHNSVVVSKYYNIFYCNDSVNKTFCEIYFKSYNMIMFYNKMATGSLVEKKRVHFSEFIKFEIPFPSLLEQTKIANFLTAVDEKITQLTQKGELLARYKKGMMQQIFSQQLRFKDDDGRKFPDWEEKSLGDLTQIYDGTHMTPNYTKSGIPFYSVEHITNNNFKDTKFISRDVFERENKRVRLEKGDILMTKIGDIGTPKYIDWDVEASFYVSLALIKKSNKASSLYLAHFIRTRFFQNELHKRIIHVAFPKKINLGEISNCMVNLPCQKEQTKIANFLTALDDKISHNQTQLDVVKQYKQGLLQQLFV